jgi:hypothetical protein
MIRAAYGLTGMKWATVINASKMSLMTLVFFHSQSLDFRTSESMTLGKVATTGD